jgi:ligand-binding sensor domain-containing protein
MSEPFCSRISWFIHFHIKIIIIGLLAFNISCKKDNEKQDQNSGFIEISNNTLNNVPVNTIMVDDSGYKWIGTAKGLFLFNNSKWYQYPKFNGRNIYSITIHDNKILLGTSIGAYTITTGSDKNSLSDSIKGNNIGSNSDTIFIYGYDNYNNQWAGTPDGLAYYDGTAWKRNKLIRNNLGGIYDVRSMAFRNDDCFFGTYGKFIFHIKYGKPTTVDAITGASQMIGGAENPVNNFNGELTTDTIYCVFAGSDSSIWFGSNTGLTRNKGITNVNSGFFEYFLRGQRVHCCIETSDKKIFVGTESGIYMRNGNVWTNYNLSNGLPGNLINCFAEDKDMTIWIGTNNGISHFVNGSFIQ